MIDVVHQILATLLFNAWFLKPALLLYIFAVNILILKEFVYILLIKWMTLQRQKWKIATSDVN